MGDASQHNKQRKPVVLLKGKKVEPRRNCSPQGSTCRVCHKEDKRENLIQPCRCKIPSLRYAHAACVNVGGTCGLCNAEYQSKSVLPSTFSSFTTWLEKQPICNLPLFLFYLRTFAIPNVPAKGPDIFRHIKTNSCHHPHCCMIFALLIYSFFYGGMLGGRLAMWVYSGVPWADFVLQPFLDTIGLVIFGVCGFVSICVVFENLGSRLEQKIWLALILPYLTVMYQSMFVAYWIFRNVFFWFVPDDYMPPCVDLNNMAKGAGLFTYIYGFVIIVLSSFITLIVRTTRDYHQWKIATYPSVVTDFSGVYKQWKLLKTWVEFWYDRMWVK